MFRLQGLLLLTAAFGEIRIKYVISVGVGTPNKREARERDKRANEQMAESSLPQTLGLYIYFILLVKLNITKRSLSFTNRPLKV
jgi:hypothetical protein